MIFEGENAPIQLGKWEYLHKTQEKPSKVTVLATGERCLLLAMQALKNLQAQGLDFDVVNARFVKPLDEELLKSLQTEHVITLEDNVFLGGFGSMVCGALTRLEKGCKIRNFAYRDEFIKQGSVGVLQNEYGVNYAEIKAYLERVLV